MIKPFLLAALPLVVAWPGVMQLNERIQKQDIGLHKRDVPLQRRFVEPPPRAPLFKSGRPNTSIPPSGFNAKDQYVNVSQGSGHEFIAPTSTDHRGECPGLNAAANHGFLPHNGLPTTQDTIDGLGAAYNMSPELALFLAIVSEAFAGDPLTQTWSIGGSFPASVPLLEGQPGGITSTHNKYEGDASIVRGDAYLNNGDVGVFQLHSWNHLFNLSEEYTLDDVAAQSDYVTRWSILNNPYYFSAPFAGLVAPAAHNFVINFMSNHSAEVPGGTLTRDILKSFFAVTGEPGSFVQNRGMERIPDNWYRRPSAAQYNIVQVLVDDLINNQMYPGIVRFGGNTGTTNSFAGVDLENLTGGVFNLSTLAEGNNGACFLLQASLAVMPDATDPALGTLGSILGFALQELGPLMSKFECPQLDTFNNALFNAFPGYTYKAEGQTK